MDRVDVVASEAHWRAVDLEYTARRAWPVPEGIGVLTCSRTSRDNHYAWGGILCGGHKMNLQHKINDCFWPKADGDSQLICGLAHQSGSSLKKIDVGQAITILATSELSRVLFPLVWSYARTPKRSKRRRSSQMQNEVNRPGQGCVTGWPHW